MTEPIGNRNMNIVSLLFSLDTLDGRLAPPTDVKLKQKVMLKAGKSRWNTWEFYLYYIVFVTVIPMMFKAGIDATNSWNPNYVHIERLLSPGWILGRKMDNSDDQYRFFRTNFFLLATLAGAHILFKKLVVTVTKIPIIHFDLIFGLIFLTAAHGVNIFRILFHVLIMFAIVKILRDQRKLATLLSWSYGIGTLFFNSRYRKYPFGNIVQALAFMDQSFIGIIERWDVFFNFTLLRMLSFNMDYLERWDNSKNSNLQAAEALPQEIPPKNKTRNKNRVKDDKSGSEKCISPTIIDERARLIFPHDIKDYGLVNYLAYVFYTPLYIAGPILTFNDYVYQTRHTLTTIKIGRVVRYALNFLCCIFTMEVLLHFIYVVAVSKKKAWAGDSPFQISVIGLLNLNVIWLKLLIPWRFFRLWSLIDGIDPPENMIRSVDNNYSTLAFWRAWHRSYNKWVIRYIYIPLGGSSHRVLTSLAVFSFVAIWHDIELRLLLWGWMIVLFLVPEITATKVFQQYSSKSWYRHLCAFGGAINIWMMIIANLFGFCLGQEGTKKLLRDLFCTASGLLYFMCSLCVLFVAVQVMFEQREHEKRQGIYVKC